MSTTSQLRSAIDASVQYRDKVFLKTWQENVNFRVMKPFGAESDQDRVAVPEDWSRTRQKTANLSFQLPKILARARRPEFEAAARPVSALVNEKLANECRAAYMVDECLADVVNGAGIMVSVLGIDRRTETVEVEVQGPPLTDPTGAPLINVDGTPILGEPTTRKVTRPVSSRYYWNRISPASFLWPVEFTGSDWEQAPWLGYESWVPVQEAKTRWPVLAKEGLEGGDAPPDLLSKDIRKNAPESDTTQYVKVQTIWYRAAKYDADVVHPDCLRRLTFLSGRTDPLEGPETDWQTWVPPTPPSPPSMGPDGQQVPGTPGTLGRYHGLTAFPIRVGTLTYVSDVAVPPSDSEAGRSQVREMIESRSQMIRQRRSAVPVRWYDVNRLDEQVAESMRRGEWQDMIPVNGPGDRVVGEVARASYPRESFDFQRIAGGDLDRAWSMSANQLVATNTGERSAAEVNAVASSNSVRLDYEKGRVNRYVAEGAAALFSLMQKFMTDVEYVTVVGPDGREALQALTKAQIQGEFAFDFKTDSSDRVDIATKRDQTIKAYNLLANSPTTNRGNLEREVWDVLGFDPAKMIAPPQEKAPDPPNISFRFGGEDLLNPIAVAFMIKAGYDVGQKEIEAAQMMIRDAVVGMQQRAQQPQMTASGPPAPGAEGSPPPRADVTPPEMAEPILKRAGDGSRLM